MDSNVMVSIVCNTYNHEMYIRDALDSFLMQITTFPYEVLIHDDASTDNTAKIIKEYELRYPDIIKPYYQQENQYSKGVNFGEKYQYSRVRGKYIAFCEGDDYWTDKYKLQKQFDAMEVHPEVDMCAHASYKVNNGKKVGEVAPKSVKCIIDTNDVILGGGAYLATNSLFYRTEMRKNKPEFIKQFHLDYFVQIWGSIRGGILYIPDYMSCYRVAVPGGWTSRMSNNKEARINHLKRVNSILLNIDKETNYKYSRAIDIHVMENSITILEMECNYNEIINGRFKSFYNQLPFNRKIKLMIKNELYKLGFNI